MREKRRHAALENRPAADREQLLRLIAPKPPAQPAGRDDRCDVHQETLIIWGLGETSDARLAEERRHGACLALDRLARGGCRAREQLDAQSRRLA
jgi:hypothetical protein